MFQVSVQEHIEKNRGRNYNDLMMGSIKSGANTHNVALKVKEYSLFIIIMTDSDPNVSLSIQPSSSI